MKTIALMTLATLVALLISLGLRLGLHKPVSITEGEAGPFRQVFAPHVGAYHKIVPVIQSVEAWARENAESCEQTFGEYLDDPAKVDEDRLQSYGGCLVGQDWREKRLPPKFSYRELPVQDYVIARFDGAPSVSPYKVYPKALEFIKKTQRKLAGPVMEVYRVVSDQAVETTYYFPVQPINQSNEK